MAFGPSILHIITSRINTRHHYVPRVLCQEYAWNRLYIPWLASLIKGVVPTRNVVTHILDHFSLVVGEARVAVRDDLERELH